MLPPILLMAGSGYTYSYITFAEGVSCNIFCYVIVTITIDRPWTEPPQQNSGYTIYQVMMYVRMHSEDS